MERDYFYIGMEVMQFPQKIMKPHTLFTKHYFPSPDVR